MNISSDHSIGGRWIVGGALISVGILFLLMNVGIIERFHLWQFWPVILMVIGINKFLQPYHHAEGFWLFFLGVWLQVSILHIWDLGFRDTWPAVLVGLGIYWMWESFEKESRRRDIQSGVHL